MSANQEHVHLAWPLWADLRVIPTHGEFRSLVRPLAIFARSCLVDLNRMTTTIVNNSVFRSFFEKQKLVGPNFIDWYRNLRIVLSVEDKLPFLEQPIPAMPALKEIAGLMLMTMDPDIQKNLEQLVAYDILKELKTLAGRIQKNQKKKPHKAAKGNQGKGKAKMGYAPMHAPSFAPKPKNSLTPKKDNPAKDAICHQCGEGSRKLKPGALSLYIGNGHRVGVAAIGEFHLCLPSFVNYFDGNVLSVSKNNLVYFSAIPRDDIYEIDLSSSNTNDSSMYVVSNKRAKLNLDSTLLWHCRLGHISKKRIKKLQHDRLLDSTDIKQGASYFVTFTDDFSRYGYVYLLKHNHEVFETFKIFQKEVENQLGKTIKSLRSDRGGEYMSQEFLDHLKDHGIIAHITPPYTPHHNGVSERRNRTLLDMVRSMMSQTTLPNSFWDYALESATRILNMVLTKKVDKTPYKVWHGQAPKLSYLKVWGCEALVKRDTLTKPDKLEPRSFRCIFVGYPNETMDILSTTHPRTKTRRAPDLMRLHIDAEEHELGDLGEPANYKAALLDPKSDKWLNAMNVEMQSMRDNRVWDLVYLPPNDKTVGHKWLFKTKTDMDGAVHTYKARLVAKGFTQTLGIDYEETFSPVADIRAIRILIAITAFYDYVIWQTDVRTVFLNGYLNKEDVKSYLGRCFAMKDLGEAAYILGIKIYRDRSKRLIGLCQSAYIEKILKRYFMENSKRGTIPMQEKLKLSKSQGELHWTTVKNILKYLRNTKDMFLVYGGDMKRELRVSCYTDAGYLTDADDMKSQTGYVFVLNGGVVDWKSTKQSIFATSSTDAEYIAAFDASKEAVWIRKFIYGLGVVPTIEEPINMYCDNTGAIAIAKDHGVTKGARHFRAKVHYLRETIEMGDVRIEKVDTDDNLADPFTIDTS
ncbi:retrotransposon protein, putative, ty1-copia subclass [Tanacetum coccineum]